MLVQLCNGNLKEEDGSREAVLLEIQKSTRGNNVHSEVLTLLKKYKVIFREPTALPPNRTYDHKIPLVD